MYINLNTKTDDYRKLSPEESFKVLKSSPSGLTSEEAKRRIEVYGYNEVKEKEVSPLLKFLSYFYGPMPFVIEVAAVLSIILHHWDDFILIIVLLFTNVIVTYWQERSASNAIKELMNRLALKARVLRNKAWAIIDARELVPGDIIRLRIGDIIPADAKLVEGEFLSVDQSALTGESLPVEKKAGDVVYSGSVVKRGEMTAIVVNTGKNTYIGHTAHLVASASSVTGLSKIISKIVYFLVGLAIILGAITFYYGVSIGLPILSDLLFVLILLVASIPIALPVVLTVTMSLGALSLARRKAIVRRLVAIEEMASMDVLCSDKTGTLTENKLTVGQVFPVGNNDVHDVLFYASLASKAEDMDAIDQAIYNALGGNIDSSYRQVSFIPFDPVRKRTEATIEHNGTRFKVMKGEPNTVLSLCNGANIAQEEIEAIKGKIEDFALKGFRVIAVAINRDKGWQFVGLIPLYDPLRPDAKETISIAKSMGITIKMVTGDNEAIAKEIGKELGLGSRVITAEGLEEATNSKNFKAIENADIFARVYPEHKFSIVKALQNMGHIVGMTGDGVNDAPALKEAQVGIAVHGATDAAKSAASIVFAAPGISTIIKAIQEGRRIFERMQSYVLYRVVETLRILIFITATVILLHFYPITALLLIVLALLNDLPIIAVSTDNVIYSPKPEKWNMKYIAGLSTLLGGMGAGETLLLIYLGISIFHLGIAAILSIVFLKLVASGHLTMFVTRSRKAFWKIPPSRPLLVALLSTIVVAYAMVIFGLGMPPINNEIAGFVIIYAFIWFLVEDGLRILYDRVNKRHALRGS